MTACTDGCSLVAEMLSVVKDEPDAGRARALAAAWTELQLGVAKFYSLPVLELNAYIAAATAMLYRLYVARYDSLFVLTGRDWPLLYKHAGKYKGTYRRADAASQKNNSRDIRKIYCDMRGCGCRGAHIAKNRSSCADELCGDCATGLVKLDWFLNTDAVLSSLQDKGNDTRSKSLTRLLALCEFVQAPAACTAAYVAAARECAGQERKRVSAVIEQPAAKKAALQQGCSDSCDALLTELAALPKAGLGASKPALKIAKRVHKALMVALQHGAALDDKLLGLRCDPPRIRYAAPTTNLRQYTAKPAHYVTWAGDGPVQLFYNRTQKNGSYMHVDISDKSPKLADLLKAFKRVASALQPDVSEPFLVFQCTKTGGNKIGDPISAKTWSTRGRANRNNGVALGCNAARHLNKQASTGPPQPPPTDDERKAAAAMDHTVTQHRRY